MTTTTKTPGGWQVQSTNFAWHSPVPAGDYKHAVETARARLRRSDLLRRRARRDVVVAVRGQGLRPLEGAVVNPYLLIRVASLSTVLALVAGQSAPARAPVQVSAPGAATVPARAS